MIFKKTVTVSTKDAVKLQGMLSKNEESFSKDSIRKDHTFSVYAVKFTNGFHAEIKVCSEKSSCYVDSALFSSSNNEVQVIAPRNKLLGTYTFHHNSDRYIISLQK